MLLFLHFPSLNTKNLIIILMRDEDDSMKSYILLFCFRIILLYRWLEYQVHCVQPHFSRRYFKKSDLKFQIFKNIAASV